MTTLNQTATDARSYLTHMENTMNTRNRSRSILTTAAVMAILALTTNSANAVLVSATGWDVDFILGSGETYAAHEKPVNANIWFAEDSTVGVPGLPASGAVVAAGLDFQFQPFTGGTDNARNGAGDLDLISPDQYLEISLLGSAISGISGNMTLNFSDAPSTSPIALSFPAWSSGTADLSPSLTSNGSSTAFTGGMSAFTYDLAANGLSENTLTSITYSGGGAIFALNGVATPHPVPEPSTLLLFGLGALGLVCHTHRRRQRA